jgi:hypothetical protein
VAACRLVEWRDADEAVDAGLGEEHPVDVIAVDREGRALDAGFIARLHVHHFALEAAPLRPAQVHPEEHLGPVLRFGPPRAGMDGDDGILAVVLATEHLLGLAGLDFDRELVEPAREVLDHGLTRLRPLDQHREVVDTALERVAHVAVVFEPAPPLQQLLRRRLVFPEVGIGDALLYLRELVAGACGVKDSSADRTRAWRDPDTGGAGRLMGELPFWGLSFGVWGLGFGRFGPNARKA